MNRDAFAGDSQLKFLNRTGLQLRDYIALCNFCFPGATADRLAALCRRLRFSGLDFALIYVAGNDLDSGRSPRDICRHLMVRSFVIVISLVAVLIACWPRGLIMPRSDFGTGYAKWGLRPFFMSAEELVQLLLRAARTAFVSRVVPRVDDSASKRPQRRTLNRMATTALERMPEVRMLTVDAGYMLRTFVGCQIPLKKEAFPYLLNKQLESERRL